MRKTIADITNHKAPIVCLTAYTAPMAEITDQHCDLLLVGDSVSMVIYGANSTQEADMEMMIRHGKAVVQATSKSLIIVDMPYGSYENCPVQALKNAQTLMDETGCHGVKLEGGKNRAETIQFLTENDIPVMAHIGLLPQSVSDSTGYKVQGREEEGAQILISDAKAIQEAGAFSVVIEAIPEPLAAEITEILTIPTIGIGASNACDGQILVTEDILGLSLGSGHTPKFVKKYANLNSTIDTAIQNYADEVKNRTFPAIENTYKASLPTPQKKTA